MLFYLFFILVFLYFALVLKRLKKYKYDQKQDYIYNIEENYLTTLDLTNNTIDLSDIDAVYDTLFLKIELGSNFLSYLFKPYIKIEDSKHYFEYGARGIRYINLSHISRTSLNFSLHAVTLNSKQCKLYGYKNGVDTSKKILILAPHADDAEIAAFGYYASHPNSTAVTITLGEDGNCNYCQGSNNKKEATLTKIKLRLHDSLSIPLLGGLNSKNILHLGYFGSSLEFMYKNKGVKATSKVIPELDINSFRNVTHTDYNLQSNITATYESLVKDLDTIITSLQPDIIITPHPQIDSHSDHKYTTLFLLDVLETHNCKPQLYLYTNHHIMGESYPLGSIHSAIDLPPSKSLFTLQSICSFPLNKTLQSDKFFALEAHHDLRNPFVFLSVQESYALVVKLIRRKIFSKDKSYFRRAVRENELFFVIKDIKKDTFE